MKFSQTSGLICMANMVTLYEIKYTVILYGSSRPFYMYCFFSKMLYAGRNVTSKTVIFE